MTCETSGVRGRPIKIENEEGLRNFGEIPEASNGIMAARDELDTEIPSERVSELVRRRVVARRSQHVGRRRRAQASDTSVSEIVLTAIQWTESVRTSPTGVIVARGGSTSAHVG